MFPYGIHCRVEPRKPDGEGDRKVAMFDVGGKSATCGVSLVMNEATTTAYGMLQCAVESAARAVMSSV